MRPWLATAATVLLVVLPASTGCGYAVKGGGFRAAGPGEGSGGGSAGSGADIATSAVCDQVRQGIDAFNQGDFEGTVDHFTDAVPLAHQRVVADDTATNEQLLAAVVYYAELPPEQYLAAAQSSPDFARYKQITLGLCVSGTAPAPESSSPGLTT